MLTEWNDGYLKILREDGSIEEILASHSPYALTHDTDVDNQRGLIYYDGYLAGDDINLPDYASGKLMEYNINTQEHREVKSETKGRGFGAINLSFKLDEVRQNIVGTQNGYLKIIDTFSGDGVLVNPR